MSRKAFQNLLERYLKGTCTEEEREIVQRWYDLLDNDEHLDLSEVEFDELEVRLWDKINTETLHSEGKKKDHFKGGKWRSRWYSAAAAVILLVIGGWWVNQRLSLNPIEPSFVTKKVSGTIVHRNVKEEPVEIILPDSSRVKLFKGAEVQYAKSFQERDVKLKGNALFNVTTDPNHPFRVFHEGMITRVLGTCFMIKEGAVSGNNEVIVYSGRVEVIRSSKKINIVERIIEKPTAVKLTPNQRVILNEENNTLTETLVEDPIPIETKKQALLDEVLFKEISLSDLSKRLGEVYGIEIKVNPSLRKITFTGDLSDMELFNQLRLICNVTETTYHMEGKSIIIQ